MNGYSATEVARLLGLPVGRIYSYVRSGFLAPERGEGGAIRFTFQDVVVLRAAKGLVDARISPVRVRKILERLVTDLPEGSSLAGLTISAEGSRVVAKDAGESWEPESGQRLFDFEGAALVQEVEPIGNRWNPEAGKVESERTADQWFEIAVELEVDSTDEAREAYRKAIELDPGHADARVNLGRLLHERGELAAAEEQYLAALDADGESLTAAFNLGVVLEDGNRTDEAVAVYERALKLDAEYADAHFNLARLYERTGRTIAALRHRKAYERLTRSH